MTDPQTADVPVLVIGAGPTGLMMASELARYGIRCRIVDKAPEISPLSRALAIHARTLEIFENIGIADQFVSAGVKAHGASIYAGGKRIVHLSFDAIESRYNFALMLPQDQTESLLTHHLENLGVKIDRSTELVGFTQDSDRVTATLRLPDGRTEPCRAAYLIGCDGAHSVVRHSLNLPFEGLEYEETFALADLMVDSAFPDDEISGFASEKGLLFFFPISHGRFRLIADVSPAGSHREPTLAELQTIVDEHCGNDVRLHDPKWMAYFKIHRRQSTSYRVGHVFLAGDAAHIHSPAGGQGMNTGLQDAYNLAWKLALTLKGIVRPAVLDSYSAERHAVGRSVLKSTDAMTRFMVVRNPVAVGIRNHIAAFLSSTEMFRSLVPRTMAELTVNYRGSTIVAEHHEGIFQTITAFGGGPRAGDRAPDANGLTLGDRQSQRLFDLMRSDDHKLLLFAGPHADQSELANLVSIANQISAMFARNVVSYLVLPANLPASVPGWDGHVIIDNEMAMHHAYHAVNSCSYLIRPDGYVGFRSFPAGAKHLIEFLKGIFV
jgi:2-polyprenyl-6-methoxyphenol hydroxylase-like FAD-dependent oxidoreductase